jgi:predicted acylesterase/phospholipase RssA
MRSEDTMLRVMVTGSGARHEINNRGQITSEDIFPKFCESLGGAIARAGHQLVVLSDNPRHADTSVLNGYLGVAQGEPDPPAILVTRGSTFDPENQNAMKFKSQRALTAVEFKDLESKGEYPFNRVGIVQQLDIVVIIGGADGAKQFVEIAYALKKTLVPVACFGGVAEKVWDRLESLVDNKVGNRKDVLTDYFSRVSHSRSDAIVAIAEELERVTPKKTGRQVTRVLSIDGGGIRGLIPAVFCEAMESRSGSSIHKMFDLVAGTSTGGILALGLASPPHGIPASQLVKLYENHGAHIFSQGKGVLGNFITGPKYSGVGLQRILDHNLPNAYLSDTLIEVLVTAYDLERRRPRAFKRWRAKEDRHQDFPITAVARATSAAPTYFPPAVIQNRGYVDGGLVANNPTMVAYAEAMRLWPKNSVLVVSIGTGAAQQPIQTNIASGWGQAQWAVPLIECMFSASSDAVDYAVQQMVPETQYKRFQINLTAGSEPLDDASPANIARLRKLGDDLVRQNSVVLTELVSQLTHLDGAGPTTGAPKRRSQKS